MIEPDTLVGIVEEIRSSKIPKNKKERTFATKYPEFAENYPGLMKVALDESIDINNLYYMVKMLRQVKDNKMTQDDATVNVGQKLFDEFVQPVVSDVDHDSKQRAKSVG